MNKYDIKLRQLREDYENNKKVLEEESIKSKTHKIPEEERELAEILHSKLCHHNHTDGCGWFYDNGDWTEYSRERYLKKARELLAVSDRETVEKIINLI